MRNVYAAGLDLLAQPEVLDVEVLERPAGGAVVQLLVGMLDRAAQIRDNLGHLQGVLPARHSGGKTTGVSESSYVQR